MHDTYILVLLPFFQLAKVPLQSPFENDKPTNNQNCAHNSCINTGFA